MPTTSQRDTRFTYEDYVRIPNDGKRHEIIDGVHYVTPTPVVRHQRIVGRLYQAIANYLDAHPGLGEVFGAPLDTVFSRWDVVEPDLLLVAADQREIVTEANVQGAPALIVEVLSPGSKKRDLGAKRSLFDRGGVGEYWIVDPKANCIIIHRRRADGSFPRAAVLHVDDKAELTTPLLPGFALSLARLFRP